MTDFDLWEAALAKRNDVESRTVHGNAHGTGVYVSRTFFFRNWTRFYEDPVYHVFIGGRLIVSTTDYLEAYAVWSREEGGHDHDEDAVRPHPFGPARGVTRALRPGRGNDAGLCDACTARRTGH